MKLETLQELYDIVKNETSNKQDAIEWGEKRIDKRIVADFIGTENTKDDQTFTPPSRRSIAESEDSMCEVM